MTPQTLPGLILIGIVLIIRYVKLFVVEFFTASVICFDITFGEGNFPWRTWLMSWNEPCCHKLANSCWYVEINVLLSPFPTLVPFPSSHNTILVLLNCERCYNWFCLFNAICKRTVGCRDSIFNRQPKGRAKSQGAYIHVRGDGIWDWTQYYLV